MKELLCLLRIKYSNRRLEVRVIILYKGAGIDHRQNMKLQFHTDKKKNGAEEFQCLYLKHGRQKVFCFTYGILTRKLCQMLGFQNR